MSERTLVSQQTIAALDPIPGADRIERATVLGWHTVVKKGEFQVGDPCIWFEIDAFLPASDPRYEFLSKTKRTWRGLEGYRLKTMKMKGVCSQGLALPVSLFPEGIPEVAKWEEDEPTQSLSGNAKGTFPSFLVKTDQERIQNCYQYIDKDAVYEVTVKMDGTSLTVYKNGDALGVCSRNQELKLDDPENAGNLYVRMARESGILDFLAAQPRNLAIQGEIAGPGIQKNRAKLAEVRVFIFDVYDIDARRYLSPAERTVALGGLDRWGDKPVRDIEVLQFSKCPELATLEGALAAATGPGFTPELREGLVYKRADGQASFKIISNEYLLAHGL